MKVVSIANANKMGYVGHDVREHIDKRNDEWYTPIEWVRMADYVMNGIGLDPFSSEVANKRVMAKRFFTEQDDAFQQEWHASSVWMNPPYTRGVVDRAADKFLAEFEARHFLRGIVLVNNMTDTRWYRRLDEASQLSSNLTGRIGFENAAGQRISGNTRGQTVFLFVAKGKYRNDVVRRFKSKLKEMGHIVKEKV